MTSEQQNVVKRHQQEAPVDITALATDLGLAVFESDDLESGVSGQICLDPDADSPSGYSISVNANDSYRRRRFTIAHECAHFLLHKDKIGSELTDNVLYRSEKLDTKEEFEANNRAAELLMPRRLVHAYMLQGLGSANLAEKFEVSEAAMRVRLRYLYQSD